MSLKYAVLAALLEGEASGYELSKVFDVSPDKRMFTLTEAGRRDLRSFAVTPPRRPSAVRDELLIKIQAMDGADPEATRALVQEREAWSRGKLSRYQRVRERLLAGHSEEEYLREADRIGPYLTLMGGIAFEEENLRWCARVLTILKQRAPLG
ncbi:PadR family transcriptional regulator [Streptomyces coeruleorubidus]|uniref:PadR family transcriptional regulator n=1 Tax=Streptomyces coeruleorubidus TaxID=116188 RepID=UPI0033A65C5F